MARLVKSAGRKQPDAKTPPQFFLSILLTNEKGAWIAQCLEWDIAAQDESPMKALQAFEQVFWARVMRDREKDRPILSNLDRAPDEFWDQFSNGMPFRNAYPLRPPAAVRVPRAEAIEIRLAA
jgi:hypothetical protein